MNHSPFPSHHLETATHTIRPATMTHISVLLHPHAVVLHKDEYHQNRREYVEGALTIVVGVLTREGAKGITETAFRVGRAVVIECPKELAEYYQERLSAYGLTVTVEEVQ